MLGYTESKAPVTQQIYDIGTNVGYHDCKGKFKNLTWQVVVEAEDHFAADGRNGLDLLVVAVELTPDFDRIS